ncbi:MAG: peptidoglycan-binding domain-containing protein [Candidatus Limiplasma sp.]|nr:peptidoglycan-binding domain-containing protein [Candidatus Limiplasma sp.]
MLSLGDLGTKVRELQKLLIDKRYFAGSVNGDYGGSVREAVILAQKHYGLLQTGSADGKLMECLTGIVGGSADSPASKRELLQQGGISLIFDRYWYAYTMKPSKPDIDDDYGYSAGNSDNVLAVFEGEIRNDAKIVLELGWQLRGTIYLDDYPYGCTFFCERDQGSVFDTQLLPQARTRFIVTAEVPMVAVNSKEVRLVFEYGNEMRVFEGTEVIRR